MPDKRPPRLFTAFGMPPERAIEYFDSRGLRIAGDWKTVADAVKAGSFSVAGVLKAQVLDEIQAALGEAIADGTTYEQFKAGLVPKLQSAGWWGRWPTDPETGEILPGKGLKPRRLETVFRTNVQGAYMGGRYKALVEASDSHPYWQYVAVLDDRTRPRHRALNGRVFRWDDPIWQVIFPPNGYNCRCRVRPLSQQDMDREGLAVSIGGDHLETITVDLGPRGGKIPVTGYRDPATGERFAPDPGFDHNPAGAWGLDVELARRVAAIRSREIRTQTWQALNNSEERLAAYWNWTQEVLDTRRPGNTSQVIGFVDEDVAEFFRSQGQEPVRVLAINEKRLVHADSEAHQVDGIALSREAWAGVPGIVAKPDDVYFDTKYQNFVYVQRLADGGVNYLAIDAGYNAKRVGRIDTLVNVYRLLPDEAGAGRLNTARYRRMG